MSDTFCTQMPGQKPRAHRDLQGVKTVSEELLQYQPFQAVAARVGADPKQITNFAAKILGPDLVLSFYGKSDDVYSLNVGQVTRQGVNPTQDTYLAEAALFLLGLKETAPHPRPKAPQPPAPPPPPTGTLPPSAPTGPKAPSTAPKDDRIDPQIQALTHRIAQLERQLQQLLYFAQSFGIAPATQRSRPSAPLRELAGPVPRPSPLLIEMLPDAQPAARSRAVVHNVDSDDEDEFAVGAAAAAAERPPQSRSSSSSSSAAARPQLDDEFAPPSRSSSSLQSLHAGQHTPLEILQREQGRLAKENHEITEESRTLQHRLSQTERDLQALTQEKEHNKQHIRQLEERLGKQTEELRSAQEALHKVSEVVRERDREISSLKARIADIEPRIGTLTKELEQNRTAIQRAGEESAATKRRLGELEAQIAQLQRDKAQIQADATRQVADVTRQKDLAIAGLTQQIRQLEADKAALAQRAQSSHDEAHRLSEANNVLQREVSGQAEILATYKRQMDSQAGRLEAASKEREELLVKVQQQDAALQSASAELLREKARSSEAEQTVLHLRAEATRTAQTIGDLQQAAAAHASEISRLTSAADFRIQELSSKHAAEMADVTRLHSISEHDLRAQLSKAQAQIHELHQQLARLQTPRQVPAASASGAPSQERQVTISSSISNRARRALLASRLTRPQALAAGYRDHPSDISDSDASLPGSDIDSEDIDELLAEDDAQDAAFRQERLAALQQHPMRQGRGAGAGAGSTSSSSSASALGNVPRGMRASAPARKMPAHPSTHQMRPGSGAGASAAVPSSSASAQSNDPFRHIYRLTPEQEINQLKTERAAQMNRILSLQNELRRLSAQADHLRNALRSSQGLNTVLEALLPASRARPLRHPVSGISVDILHDGSYRPLAPLPLPRPVYSPRVPMEERDDDDDRQVPAADPFWALRRFDFRPASASNPQQNNPARRGAGLSLLRNLQKFMR